MENVIEEVGYYCKELEPQLEALVDKYSLATVLGTLSFVCSAKAMHIESNWQDGALAHKWDEAALNIDVIATHWAVREVSP
jgi:hypothetical protein